MTSRSPLVSVVTPFYNTADHLAECIESVLAQTHGDFEYILQNNKSTDGSVEIVEEYARRDPRIRLTHTSEFVPQLANYNHAVRHISPDSRYFKLIQADDALFPRCLEEMVAVADANPRVGVVSSYRMCGSWVLPRGIPREVAVLSGRDACRLCLINRMSLFGSQTTVLIRADIVRSRVPFYAEERYFADSDAVYEILEHADFAFIHQLLTFSRVEEDSTFGRVTSYAPLMLDRLMRLKSYGLTYLTPDEYERLMGEQEDEYRHFLAEAWLRRREPEFWEYHRKGLAIVGEPLRRPGFGRDVLDVAVRYALSPATVARAVLRRAGFMRRPRIAT